MSAPQSSLERLLQMIVCVGIADRLHAMSIRGEKGDEAAIEYLRNCTISDEDYGRTTWRPDLRVVADNTRCEGGRAP